MRLHIGKLRRNLEQSSRRGGIRHIDAGVWALPSPYSHSDADPRAR